MPFRDRVQFEVANFLYCHNQMSASNINFITGLWAASLAAHGDEPPFKNSKDMYDTIDVIPLGNVFWQSVTLNYNGPPPETLGPDGESPPWMSADYDIWFHDPHLLVHGIIGNPEFRGNSTSHLTKNTTWMASIALKFLCQEIGLGDRWY